MNHISRAFEEHRNKSPKATFSPEILMLLTLYPGQPGDVWRYSEDTPTPGGQRLEILGSILKFLTPETGKLSLKVPRAIKKPVSVHHYGGNICISAIAPQRKTKRKEKQKKSSCQGPETAQ